jgi:molybdopterin-synthase adenylyltransferase
MLKRPLLPSHYAVWFEPPDEAGDEVLHVVSEQRAFTLKGYAFREFCERVVPLLDGSQSLDEIQASTADVFEPDDLAACLGLLETHGILVEAEEFSADVAVRMTPQLNFFRELAPGQQFQERLSEATVSVIGLGGAGPAVALGLAAAGIGALHIHDSLPVAPTDVYYSPFLGLDAVGASREARTADLARDAAPQTDVRVGEGPLESEDDLHGVLDGVDFVVCCLDAAQSNLTFKLNRVCLALGMRWISCALAGAEVVVGPAVHPGHGPCYLCYRMRAVACAGNPEAAFAHERHLDRRKSDDSGARENLLFAAGIAANMLALEVVKELTGIAEPSLVGRLLILQLTDLSTTRHTILRKPWCPACFDDGASEHA